MSTERKPGSRGVLDRSSREQAAAAAPRLANEPETRENEKTKGSSKTVSPRRAFKRKPRK
jgi:hypothetical protein